jgi:hypothetical protein
MIQPEEGRMTCINQCTMRDLPITLLNSTKLRKCFNLDCESIAAIEGCCQENSKNTVMKSSSATTIVVDCRGCTARPNRQKNYTCKVINVFYSKKNVRTTNSEKFQLKNYLKKSYFATKNPKSMTGIFRSILDRTFAINRTRDLK